MYLISQQSFAPQQIIPLSSDQEHRNGTRTASDQLGRTRDEKCLNEQMSIQHWISSDGQWGGQRFQMPVNLLVAQ